MCASSPVNSDVPLSVALGGSFEGYWLAHWSLEQSGALIPEDSDPGRVICQSGEVLQFLNTCDLRGGVSITKGGDPDTTAYMP